MDSKPYDSAFKNLAEDDAEALLRLIGALPPGARIRPLPREISAPALATDQPYEVITGTERHIAHLEAQTRWSGDVPDRVLVYETIFWVNTRLPVYSYVLVLIPDGLPADAPDTCAVSAGSLTLRSKFTIVRVWELPAAEALAQNNINLLPFIPLMKGGGEQLEQCARQIGRIEDEFRQREVALHFVSLGGLRYNRENLINLLGRTTMIPDRILRETPYIQAIIAETRAEARAEIQQTIDEARQQINRMQGEAEQARREAEEAERRVNEARQREREGRQAMTELLLYAVGKRFPGADVTAEIERVRETDALKQLFMSLDQIPDADALRVRLAALTDNL